MRHVRLLLRMPVRVPHDGKIRPERATYTQQLSAFMSTNHECAATNISIHCNNRTNPNQQLDDSTSAFILFQSTRCTKPWQQLHEPKGKNATNSYHQRRKPMSTSLRFDGSISTPTRRIHGQFDESMDNSTNPRQHFHESTTTILLIGGQICTIP